MTDDDYVAATLALFRALPGTTARSGPADRRLALRLHARDVPLDLIRAALVLGAARRLFSAAPPQTPVRSLAYFLPVVDEVLAQPPDPAYVTHLDRRLRSRYPTPGSASSSSPESRSPHVQKNAVP